MTTPYEIGPFRLDPRANVLTRGGMPVALGERGVTLLKILVDNAQEYVPKPALMDAAWPRVVVGESNLAVQISAIRRVLAQGGGQRWIETLPRRGYRFVGPLHHPPPAAQPPLSNLPAASTSFIGRDKEQADIVQRLQHARLLTLVGTGGIGKTRLALQVAAAALPRHADGVWLVELAALRDPLHVPAAVAQVLGLGERGGQTPADTLYAYLASRHVLLVLDNCEHLREAVGVLAAELLRRAPHVALLATSREPLTIDGEQVHAVASLSLPEPDAAAAQVALSDAVRLFVARAAQQQPDFGLGADNAAIVARICTQLDGLPLALELAAARVRSLSVTQIAARLDDRFRLLAAGNAAALPRHQTLRAAMEWSFDLLADDERSVLRRIAVFVGGFALESAMAVASDATTDEVAVVDVLDRLVRRSLVVADTAADFTRYRLLETTRAYALEKLAEAGETGALKRRHAAHFRDRFAAAFAQWLHLSDRQWSRLYQADQDNVRAALEWALAEDGDAAVGVELAGTSVELWKFSIERHSGFQWIERALARVSDATPPAQRALLWLRKGVYWDLLGPERMFDMLQRAAALYRACGDAEGLLRAQILHGHMLALHGRLDEAGRALAEVAPADESAIAPRLLAEYLDSASVLALMRGDAVRAREITERALALCGRIGAERLALILITNLADMTWMAGDLERAEAALREALAMARNMPISREHALSTAENNLLGVLVEKGQIDEALALARGAYTMVAEPQTAWMIMDHLALRAALAGKHGNAAKLAGFADAGYAMRKVPRQPNEVRARARLGELLQPRYSADELAALLAAGAALADAAACELALE